MNRTAERVLVVEHDLELARSMAELLAQQGYEVLRCQDSAEVEATLGGRGFELALVDLPQVDHGALSLVARLRRLSALAEVVVVTDDESLHTATAAFHSGVHAYLPKPFGPDELLGTARRALAQVALKRERQALAERLALSESLYRGVVEAVEACILGVDTQGEITFANRFALHCLADGESLLGVSLPSLADEAGQRALAQALERAQRGHSVRDRDVLHPRADGARALRWSLSPLHATDARVARRAREIELALPTATVLAVGQDITLRLGVEQRTAADRAMAAIGTLTTGLAHEIRNPLNAAKLQLELIQRRALRGGNAELAAQLSEPARLVRAELERLTTMLDEFLNLARPSPPARVPSSLRALLDQVIESEAAAATRAGITLRSELEPPELAYAYDADKLEVALLHLVRNSVEAMSPRGRGEVVLRARARDQGGLELSVIDDGPGLSAALQGRAAFEPFATSKPAGTGLGLSVVESVVAQHGGSVELVNRPEGGLLARILL